MPPFVIAHTFCASRDVRVSLGICPLIQHECFCGVYGYVEKTDLREKEKLGVIVHFSEIIDLKFGKKMPYILCILTLF